MRMSKHHATALLLLGIAVCAGLFLSVPAAAGSGQGLEALESGNLLVSPLGNLSAAGNRSGPAVTPEPAVTPALPEDTPDALPDPGDAGPDNSSRPAEPVPVTGATPGATDAYDDERLARLINTASISLMRLSMEHAHALYLQDADAASAAADDLHALSIRLLGEVEPLRVSPAKEPVKDEFIRVLKEYSAASEALLGTTTSGEDAVPAALDNLSAASIDLEAVNRQALDLRPAVTGVPAVSAAATTLAAGSPAVSAGTGPAPVAPPAEALPLGERYTYDDPSGENMVSLLAESTRTVTAYEAASTNKSTTKVEAGEGRIFLLVVVKGTNLGHKGDSELYSVETPGREAFVLEYQGTAFTPLDVPAFTLHGESFDKKTLERYESQKGYLYFDVPATFDVSGAILRADLGDAGTPAWDLGRELGDESAA